MIRPARGEDIPRIVDMSRKFYATTSYSGLTAMDDETVAALTRNLLENHVMLVSESEGGVDGMVGLFVAPFMFNASYCAAYEVVWWVEPYAQGLGVGKALLAAIEPACKDRGAQAIQMVHLSTSPPQAAAIYERMGYAHSESSYTKRIS